MPAIARIMQPAAITAKTIASARSTPRFLARADARASDVAPATTNASASDPSARPMRGVGGFVIDRALTRWRAPPKPVLTRFRRLCAATHMSAQYIFTTYKLSRRYPPDREALTDISLSFLPGAKIGVLGYNGAGKSTLLRIMAGQDNDYDGQAQLAPGATVGLLEQEPELDPSKDVRGNIEEAVAEVRSLLDRFNELSMS